ncbi:MAG: hypothetical protein GY943_14520 [Chloroflexi bacterium]|nr:hypothetical protein [Chloroflexota bacterium]
MVRRALGYRVLPDDGDHAPSLSMSELGRPYCAIYAWFSRFHLLMAVASGFLLRVAALGMWSSAASWRSYSRSYICEL